MIKIGLSGSAGRGEVCHGAYNEASRRTGEPSSCSQPIPGERGHWYLCTPYNSLRTLLSYCILWTPVAMRGPLCANLSNDRRHVGTDCPGCTLPILPTPLAILRIIQTPPPFLLLGKVLSSVVLYLIQYRIQAVSFLLRLPAGLSRNCIRTQVCGPSDA